MNNSIRYYVMANGCPENRLDAAGIQDTCAEMGWEPALNLQTADVIIYSACSLTRRSQDFSVASIRRIISQKRKDARFVLCGCLPAIAREQVSSFSPDLALGFDQTAIFGEQDFAPCGKDQSGANYLLPYVTPLSVWRRGLLNIRNDGVLNTLLRIVSQKRYDRLHRESDITDPWVFKIKISTGCLDACTFCAVRISRGRVRSKPIGKILTEFENGLQAGFKDFALIGTDLGAYGRDADTTLVQLLGDLLAREEDFSIRLRNINPKYLLEMFDDFMRLCETGKIGYISSAVESGSNRILKLMKRDYTIEDYKAAITRIKETFPKIFIRTQIITGFPTETEEEFLQSYRLLEELDLDFVEVFMFDPVPDIKASRMDGQLPKGVARQRYRKLYRKALRFQQTSDEQPSR